MKLRYLALLLAASLFSCKKSEPAPAAAAEPPPVAAEARPAEENDASMASVSGKSDPNCVGPVDTEVPETLQIAGKTYELNGYLLTAKGEAPQEAELKLGVLANMNQATGENLFNLRRYLDYFKAKGVDAILVAGDSGEERKDIEAILAAVAESGVPVLAIAGNRERTTDFVDAIREIRKSRPNLLNGNRVRQVALHGLDVITLPGYHDARYIHQEPGNGCRYFKEDVRAVEKLAGDAKNPVLLLAHGQPKGTTPTALDVIAPGKEHIGDANLNKAVEGAKIAFGIFANVKEAGGQAVADLQGEKVVAEGEWSERLYLNPGAADAVEWVMNDGGTSSGMAAVLHVKEGKASHSIFRAPKLTEAERAEAVKLVPAGAAAQAE